MKSRVLAGEKMAADVDGFRTPGGDGWLSRIDTRSSTPPVHSVAGGRHVPGLAGAVAGGIAVAILCVSRREGKNLWISCVVAVGWPGVKPVLLADTEA